MSIDLSGKVGPLVIADGASSAVRLGKAGEQVVQELHGRFYEQNYRGNVYSLDSDSVTLASANATKSAGGTIKLINGFWNPTGSDVNAVILKTLISTVSGTPAGPLFYNFFPTAAPVSSTPTGTIRQGITGRSSGSKLTPLVNVVVSVAPADTSNFIQHAVVGGPAAIAAGAGNYSVADVPEGVIIIPPGVIFGLTCTGAGTSHVVQTTMWWEEVPI